LSTELLQVQLELQPHRSAASQSHESGSLSVQDEEGGENSTTRVYYGRVKVDSPHWCAHIPWLVQFAVPPCWFGKPRNETLGPDGTPDWCKWVAADARAYTPDCRTVSHSHATEPLGTSYPSAQDLPKQAPAAPVAPAAVTPAAAPKKKEMPAWCKEIPQDALKFTPDCNSKTQSLWLQQQKTNENANSSVGCSGTGHLPKGATCYGGAFLTEVFFVKAHHGRVSMWAKGPKPMKCLNRRFHQSGRGISISGVSACFSDVEYNIQYCSAQDQVMVNLIKPMRVSVTLNRKSC